MNRDVSRIENGATPKEPLVYRPLSFNVEAHLLDLMDIARGDMSRRRWMLDAFREKLAREEEA